MKVSGNQESTFDIAMQLVKDRMFGVEPDGAIWRYKVRTIWGYRDIEPRRADRIAPIGYRYIHAQIKRRQIAVPAHRIVWTVLRGPIPAGFEINHKDGDKANNHPSNLELVTPSENIRHSYLSLGRPRQGSPKWSDDMRADVVRLHSEGLSYRSIERLTGVSAATARAIVIKALAHQGARGQNDVKATEVLLVNHHEEASLFPEAL
jgi:hypothetical protein